MSTTITKYEVGDRVRTTQDDECPVPFEQLNAGTIVETFWNGTFVRVHWDGDDGPDNARLGVACIERVGA